MNDGCTEQEKGSPVEMEQPCIVKRYISPVEMEQPCIVKRVKSFDYAGLFHFNRRFHSMTLSTMQGCSISTGGDIMCLWQYSLWPQAIEAAEYDEGPDEDDEGQDDQDPP